MGAPEEYLTIDELGQRLKLSPKSIANKMSAGVFVEGVLRPPSMRVRFKWSAVQRWLEGKENTAKEATKTAIPMSRGYFLPEIRSRRPLEDRETIKPPQKEAKEQN